MAHGAGSSPAVAVAAFAGREATSFWLAGHGPAAWVDDDGGRDRAVLADTVARVRPSLVAGISYGAHQVVRWAAAGLPAYVHRLALVMPAWTGPPGPIAAATAAQADELGRMGVPAALARIRTEHPGWVADALAASWPQHDPDRLVAALRGVARSRGPTEQELAAIRVPATVVVLTGDLMHPEAVAQRWAALLSGSRLVATLATGGLPDLGAAALGD